MESSKKADLKSLDTRADDSDEGSSDSDATTTSSSEHLTREEKLYVLRHTRRQDPQGQESWQQQRSCHHQHRAAAAAAAVDDHQQQQQQHDERGSVNRLDADSASSCRTLIIHGSLSDESWARITGTGSIPDLGLGGSQHYLTSTPTSKAPAFRPASDAITSTPALLDDAEDLLLLGSSDRRRRRNNHPTPTPPSGANAFSTRSLPRSAKDFSSLTYRPHLGSSSLYQHDEQEPDECCEKRKQMKILQNLAREMNWSLPLNNPKTDSYPLSIDQTDEVVTGACSALSISDTLLVNDPLAPNNTVIVHDQTSNGTSLTRDFSYLSKPPPAYPRNNSNSSNNKTPVSNDATSRNSSAASSVRRTKVRRALSRSHPDLSKLGKDLGWNGGKCSPANGAPALSVTAPVVVGPAAGSEAANSCWRASLRQKADSVNVEEPDSRIKSETSKTNNDEQAIATTATASTEKTDKSGNKSSLNADAVWSTPELVDAILEENFKLRQQVQQHADHIAKLQKFEQELAAVHSAHQSLVRSSERKESLERAARLRLEAEWRRSQEMNAALRNQIELLTSQLALRSASVSSLGDASTSSADYANQIARRDALIAQLVSQNKELVAHKERQDIELCAQKATLQQQRSHIEILESALSRAQQHVNRLEDEFRRQCNDTRHLLGSAGSGCDSNANSQADASANRELANMEIRIRDLEAKLAEKEMLIHLLQRASMDRELGYSATRPLTETVLSRHPSSVTSHHHSSQMQQDSQYLVNNSNLTPASSKNVRAASVASSSPSMRNKSAPQQSTGESQTTTSQQQPASDATQSLDNQLRALDQFYQNKQSLIKALQTDKELFPNNYWAS